MSDPLRDQLLTMARAIQSTSTRVNKIETRSTHVSPYPLHYGELPLGKLLTIPEGAQVFHFGTFEIDGTLDLQGELIVL